MTRPSRSSRRRNSIPRANAPDDDLWDEPGDNFWDNQPDPDDFPDRPSMADFDAFNVNTWSFKPAPTPWYRTRQALTAIIAASAAVAAIVVSGVLLVFRGPGGTVDEVTSSVTPTAPTSAAAGSGGDQRGTGTAGSASPEPPRATAGATAAATAGTATATAGDGLAGQHGAEV